MGKKNWLKGGLIGVGLYAGLVIMGGLLLSGFDPYFSLWSMRILAVYPFGESLRSPSQFFGAVALIAFACFLIGSFLGYLLSQSKEDRNKKEYINQILAISLIIFISIFSFLITPPTYNSLSDCHSSLVKIRRGFREDWCYRNVAIVTGDFKICDFIGKSGIYEDKFDQYQCYGLVAERHPDFNICSKIPDSLEGVNMLLDKSRCYGWVALRQGCDNFKENKERDFCNFSLARTWDYQHDSEKLMSVCKKIQDKKIQNMCINKNSDMLF